MATLLSTTVNGDLIVTGSITANSMKFQVTTSGSTVFGDTSDDTHYFTGNVGFGKSSPAALAHLYKPAVSATPTPLEMLRLEVEDTGVDMAAGHGPGITFYVGETSGTDWGGTVAVVREAEGDADSASAMVFHTAIDDTYPAERMRIGSTGNVGIGTNSPAALTHLYKTAIAASALPLEMLRLEVEDAGVDMAAGHGPGITFYVGETGGSDHGGTVAVVKEAESDADSASAMVFHTAVDDTTPAERVRITSAGKVGIGTTSPVAKLDVNGGINVTGSILPGANITYNLGSSTQRFANVYTGDLHLKNERGDWTILEEEDFLCVINNATGKKYKMMLEQLPE